MSIGSAMYADHAVQGCVEIVFNECVATDTYRIRFRFPELAERIVPGQFLMVRIAQADDPLIGRPFALYDTSSSEHSEILDCLDFIYLVSGKMTRRLAHLTPGQKLDVWGPLGNGFPVRQVDHLIMVAGGIGQTPFLAMAKEHLSRQAYGTPPRIGASARRVTLCYGARRASYFACLDEFESIGVTVKLCTDDGSAGRHGYVTAALQDELDNATSESRHVIACGPEPMLKAVSECVIKANQAAEVSLETPMACGIGICFSCVAPIRDDLGQVDYRRTCVEGPVFDAARVCWDD